MALGSISVRSGPRGHDGTSVARRTLVSALRAPAEQTTQVKALALVLDVGGALLVCASVLAEGEQLGHVRPCASLSRSSPAV
jgi:hypothetical protein